MKREERYAKHQGMKSDRKKRKRDNQAEFKNGLVRTKPGGKAQSKVADRSVAAADDARLPRLALPHRSTSG